jgi:type I restriction enzyme S subunit
MNTVTQNPVSTPKPKNTNHLSEWREYKIGQITKKAISGGTPSTKVEEYYGGNIPWLNSKEVNFNRIWTTEKFITEEGLNNSSAKWIEKNSVIVAMYGATAAKVAINKIPLTTNQACCNLIIDEKKADYEFVFYSLWNKYKEIENIAVGAAQQNLSVGVISNLPILLPPLPEQQAIAEVLSSLDDKIDLLHRQNKTLEQLAETLFRQWFIEEADERWEVGKLGDLIVPKKGKNLTKSEAIAGNYPVVAGGLEPSCYHNQANTKAPVVTISASGANAGFVRIYYTPVWSSDSSYIDETITPFVYFSYIFLKVNQKQLIDKQEGSAQPHIYPSHIMELEMVKYPKILIEKFEKEVSDIFQKTKHNTQQILTLTQLRDTLLPKLMSGEVRVSVPLI